MTEPTSTTIHYTAPNRIHVMVLGLRDWWTILCMKGRQKHIRDQLAKGFAEIEKTDHPCKLVVVGPEIQKALRLVSCSDYEPITARALVMKGYVGWLWGALVTQTREAGLTVHFWAEPPLGANIDLATVKSEWEAFKAEHPNIYK